MQPSLEWPFSDGSLAYVRRPTRWSGQREELPRGYCTASFARTALRRLRSMRSENDVSGGLNNKALEIWRMKPGLLVCASRLSSVWQGAAGQNLQTVAGSFFLCVCLCADPGVFRRGSSCRPRWSGRFLTVPWPT